MFVLENTASLVGLPDALERVTAALETLPYHWRRVCPTPPQSHRSIQWSCAVQVPDN